MEGRGAPPLPDFASLSLSSSRWWTSSNTTNEQCALPGGAAAPTQPAKVRSALTTTAGPSQPRIGKGNSTSGRASFHTGGNPFYRAFRSFSIGLGAGGAAFVGGLSGVGPAHAFSLWPFSRFGKGGRRGEKRKRILILMSDTGGGHRASAQAIKAGFEEKFGNKFQIDIIDIWSDYTPFPVREVPRSYSFMVKHSLLWRASYNMMQPALVHVPMQRLMYQLSRRQIGEAFERYQPDLVVSVHPLMQDVPLRVLKERVKAGVQQPTNFATVVTDLTTCHNTWFHRGVTHCFVATDEAKQIGLRMGLKTNQITVHGLPIRPDFASGSMFTPQRKIRKRLGLDLDKPAVLLVGGGEGMGPVEATVAALAERVGASCQVIVVCGRNKKLVRKLEAREYPAGMKVKVLGFVHNMPEWMRASSCIITKAGPGTISEALICGLPLLLNAFIPCQEEGNIPYVVDNEVGVFEKDPVQIAEIIKGWFGERKEEFTKMALRAKALAQPKALFNIVEDLAAMA